MKNGRPVNLYLSEETLKKLGCLARHLGFKSKSEYLTNFIEGEHNAFMEIDNKYKVLFEKEEK